MRELRDIFLATLTSPRLLFRQVERAIEAGAAQLFTFDAGHWATPFIEEEPVLGHLRRAVPFDVREYLSAEQAYARIDFQTLNSLQRIAVGLSSLVVLLLLLHPRWRRAVD